MAQGKVEICGVNTAKLPLLREEEKEALFLRIKAGDAAAKEEYIRGNLRLVLSVIKRFSNTNENPDDLFQVGCIGLMKAIDNFDLSQGVRFSTYAVPLILGEMKRYLREESQVKISRTVKDLSYAILKEKEKYLVEKQREPTIEELVSNLQIDQHSIIEAIQSTQSVASFQEIIGHDDQNELHLIDMIPLDKETLKHYHQHLDLKKAMTCLNPREQKVIQERYYKGYSQCEIAKELFVSQAQVSRIEKNALEKLHKKLV